MDSLREFIVPPYRIVFEEDKDCCDRVDLMEKACVLFGWGEVFTAKASEGCEG